MELNCTCGEVSSTDELIGLNTFNKKHTPSKPYGISQNNPLAHNKIKSFRIEGNKIRSSRRKEGRREAGKKELLLMILKKDSSTQVESDSSKLGAGVRGGDKQAFPSNEIF